MPIQGIFGDVDLSIFKPADRTILHFALAYFFKWPLPMKMGCDVCPKHVRIQTAFNVGVSVGLKRVNLERHGAWVGTRSY